jgi:hypothetical protein
VCALLFAPTRESGQVLLVPFRAVVTLDNEMTLRNSIPAIPLAEIPSRAQFILLDSHQRVVAECESTPDAILALQDRLRKDPTDDAVIYRRMRYAWVRY